MSFLAKRCVLAATVRGSCAQVGYSAGSVNPLTSASGAPWPLHMYTYTRTHVYKTVQTCVFARGISNRGWLSHQYMQCHAVSKHTCTVGTHGSQDTIQATTSPMGTVHLVQHTCLQLLVVCTRAIAHHRGHPMHANQAWVSSWQCIHAAYFLTSITAKYMG